MMKLYYELNLPKIIKDSAHSMIADRKGILRIVTPDEILSNELLLLFKHLDMNPYFVILFQNEKLKSDYSHRLLHRDSTLTSQNPNVWESLSMGINFELSKGINEFCWYDIGENKEIYPPDSETRHYFLRCISGVHCNRWDARGIPDGATLLDKIIITDKPMLVRTDIHHITSFDCEESRTGISIRFHEQNFNRNFELAVEKLKPIITAT